MNRATALWLSTAMSLGMSMNHEPADAHCENDGKHCTFLRPDGVCRLYDKAPEKDEDGHERLNICKERNYIIGRTA